jgi:hypothetical protein
LRGSDEFLSDTQRELLNSGRYRPSFVIPPYFMHTGDPVLRDMNLRILSMVNGYEAADVFPMLLIKNESLSLAAVANILVEISDFDFSGYCVWIDDFDEREATRPQIDAFIHLIEGLRKRADQIVVMFGGFFSMVLHHFGVTCVCHGLAYGEARALEASTQSSSGPAPVRYYVRDLHRFLTLENAALVLRERPDLMCSCQVCKRIMGGDPDRVLLYREQEELAEMHFLINRDIERADVSLGLEHCIDSLDMALTLNDDIDKITRPYRTASGVENRPVTTAAYIKVWRDALRDAR